MAIIAQNREIGVLRFRSVQDDLWGYIRKDKAATSAVFSRDILLGKLTYLTYSTQAFL